MNRPSSLDPGQAARQALTRSRHAVARLISLLEDVRPAGVAARDEALQLLESEAGPPGPIIGVTGTPGSGKSSLLARLADQMTVMDPDVTLAIVAVDPSSPTSGGAFLGDRTRMNLSPDQSRVFFRSQASANRLGGLAPSTYFVCRALSVLFDCVIVETVGIGQSEADVRHLADRVFLLLAPLGGDEIQYLKAGIVEIPDAFVLNKWDEPAAAKAYHQLRASLWLSRPGDDGDLPIYRTSAKNGHGVDELAKVLLDDIRSMPPGDWVAKAAYFFDAWVGDEWGRAGRRHLTGEQGGAASFLARHSGFGEAQTAFEASVVGSRAGSPRS